MNVYLCTGFKLFPDFIGYPKSIGYGNSFEIISGRLELIELAKIPVESLMEGVASQNV